MQRIPRTKDRRVQRTLATLREALVALIAERGWDAISVNDLCERANIGRSTFYTHCADMEDLLVSGFDELRVRLSALAAFPRPKGIVLGFSGPLLTHAYESRRLFRALIGKHSGLVVQKRFRELVIELTLNELQATLAPPWLVPLARYVAGAFFELVSWWLDEPRPLAAEEVDALFQQLTSKVTAVARSLPNDAGARL